MRALLLAFGLLLVGGMLALLATMFVLTPGTPSAPMPARATAERPGPRPGPGSTMQTERTALPEPEAATTPAPEPESESEPTPATAETTPPDTAVVTVEVRDAVRGTLLPGFRYVLVRSDGSRDARQVEGSEAELPLLSDRPTTLTVEAEGYVPRELTVPARPQQPLVVRLEPAAPRTGVELHVQDADGAPVPALEVAAFDAKTEAPELLWRRRTHDEAGRYALPDLPAGHLRLELRAIEEDGSPRPLQPQTVVVDVTGGERVIRSVQLEPGALFSLRLPTGNAPIQSFAVRLLDATGQPVDVVWVGHRAEDGKAVARRGGFPTGGTLEPQDAVPPGLYRLEVVVPDTGAQRDTQLTLQPGRNGPVDVALP